MARERSRRSHSIGEEMPPLKERLYTAFYRLRYGWQYRSSIDISDDSPVWVLGKCYHPGSNDDSRPRDVEGTPPHIHAFIDHYYSIPWMTYRANFTPIPGTSLTTDCGWGCMVRSGQMILATALHRHLLSKQWRYRPSSQPDLDTHTKILSWFADSVGDHCPFSLHSLMGVAVKHGNRPGDWFGPSQVAVLLRECCKNAQAHHPTLEQFQVYVAHDCTVYVNDVKKMFEEEPGSSLLLLVPVRLGGEGLNPIYVPCVQALVALDHCVGIIGGKPKHSVYFVGFQDDKLIHLDPHFCQTATEVRNGDSLQNFDTKSYHCYPPRKISASKMDPSCTIGFYCTSLEDFTTLRQDAEKVLAPPKQKGVYPFFTFADQYAEDIFGESLDMQLSSVGGLGTMTVIEGGGARAEGTDGGRRRGSRKMSADDFLISDQEDFVLVETRTSSNSLSTDANNSTAQ